MDKVQGEKEKRNKEQWKISAGFAGAFGAREPCVPEQGIVGNIEMGQAKGKETQQSKE